MVSEWAFAPGPQQKTRRCILGPPLQPAGSLHGSIFRSHAELNQFSIGESR
jgi:hypothetical protein